MRADPGAARGDVAQHRVENRPGLPVMDRVDPDEYAIDGQKLLAHLVDDIVGVNGGFGVNAKWRSTPRRCDGSDCSGRRVAPRLMIAPPKNRDPVACSCRSFSPHWNCVSTCIAPDCGIFGRGGPRWMVHGLGPEHKKRRLRSKKACTLRDEQPVEFGHEQRRPRAGPGGDLSGRAIAAPITLEHVDASAATTDVDTLRRSSKNTSSASPHVSSVALRRPVPLSSSTRRAGLRKTTARMSGCASSHAIGKLARRPGTRQVAVCLPVVRSTTAI